MDIGEVSKKAKVTTATLRFYEEKGLIKSIGRQGLRRQYGKQVIDQLALIALGRAAGFSLNEPYRVCRRVNILRDYPDDKIKIYP